MLLENSSIGCVILERCKSLFSNPGLQTTHIPMKYTETFRGQDQAMLCFAALQFVFFHCPLGCRVEMVMENKLHLRLVLFHLSSYQVLTMIFYSDFFFSLVKCGDCD